MLKEVFSCLLYGQEAPVADDVWELSRFAVSGEDKTNCAFSTAPVDMMREVVRFAEQRGISQYVTVTTLGVERMLKRLGVDMHRFGPPMQVGITKAVAFTIEINSKTHNALFGVEEAPLMVCQS